MSHELETYSRLYDKHFPPFRQPKEIGKFSKTDEREFQNDGRQLKIFVPPCSLNDCYFDLKSGYKDMIKKDESINCHLDNLLKWIMFNKHVFSNQGSCQQSSASEAQNAFSRLNTDFICWRGLLTRLLCIPYERRDDLLVAVIRFRGTYFMCEFDTEMKKNEKQHRTEKQEEMCCWGWKFEQYVTADPKTGVPDPNCPVNNNEEFGSVVSSKLNHHSLVYGAEVDCYEKAGQSTRYVELKTSRVIETQRQYENFCRFKLIKWWAQSFLIGISKIVCGFRDDNGIVQQLKNYNVSELPREAKSAIRDPWDASICFNFLDAFLNFVKSKITQDNERCVYLFRWQPKCRVQCENRHGDPDFLFLPKWFTDWDQWDKPVNCD